MPEPGAENGYQPYADGLHDQYVLGKVMTRHFLRFLHAALPGVYVRVCESCSPASKKFSVHVIVGAFAEHYLDVAEHALRLYNTFRSLDPLADLCARFMDMGVYKSLQNFRILGCVKLGGTPDRIKRLIGGGPVLPSEAGLSETLLTVIGAHDLLLPSVFVNVSNGRFAVTAPSEIISEVDGLPPNFMSLLEPHSVGFRVAKIVGTAVHFQRIAASWCAFCRRRHDTDNTLVVYVAKTAYIIMCRHDLTHQKIVLSMSVSLTTQKRADLQLPVVEGSKPIKKKNILRRADSVLNTSF